MFDIRSPHIHQNCEGVSRRDFIRIGAIASLGLSLADLFALRARAAASPTSKSPRARSVIQIWLGGGPSHLDTFDPKPEAGEAYCGNLRKTADSAIAGLRLGELMPLLAQQADKFSVLRGMTHPSNAHETATYIVQTGALPGGDLVYPSTGAIVALKKQQDGSYAGQLPPYITLSQPLGRFTECGFLGSAHRAYAPGGDPSGPGYRAQGITPPNGITPERLQERRKLSEAIDGLHGLVEQQAALGQLDQYQEQAYNLILGDSKKAFDLSAELPATRDRYGRHQFGQSCLLARRLVEQGVPFVTINYSGWDTHKYHFDAMRKLVPPLDQGFAALLADLSERGLLDSTIVTCGGEFGRSPKVLTQPPWYGGRGHFSSAFSTVVAGGGFTGGSVLGATDRKGETVTDRPIYPWDLTSSIYSLLGINPDGLLPHPQGCVARVVPPRPPGTKSGGLLQELMPTLT